MPSKKANEYSESDVEKMVQLYSAATSESERETAMNEIQAFTGNSIPSIRSKLVFEKVYVSKAKAVKKGSGVNKSELVQKIADANAMQTAGFFDSLEGANKTVLMWILSMLDKVSEQAAILADVEVAALVAEIAEETVKSAEVEQLAALAALVDTVASVEPQ